MSSKIIRFSVLAATLVAIVSVMSIVSSVSAQQSPATAVEALQKARVLDRLTEAKPTEKGGVVAPSFVLDPAWPQQLPHHWVIGDVGGIYVDRHDHIWLYHRPLSFRDQQRCGNAEVPCCNECKGRPD